MPRTLANRVLCNVQRALARHYGGGTSRRSPASRRSAALRWCLSTLRGLPPLPLSFGAARVFAASCLHPGGVTSYLSPCGGQSGTLLNAASSFHTGGVTSPLSPVRGAERGVAVQFSASSFHAEGVTSHLSPVRGAERGVAYLALTLCKWFALDVLQFGV